MKINSLVESKFGESLGV